MNSLKQRKKQQQLLLLPLRLLLRLQLLQNPLQKSLNQVSNMASKQGVEFANNDDVFKILKNHHQWNPQILVSSVVVS